MSSDIIGQDAVGYSVEAFELRGQEHDSDSRWVGGDMVLEVPPIGRFLCRYVTKATFKQETLESALDAIDNPQRLFREPVLHERREPFVLNDDFVTEAILVAKFQDRTVQPDLADSLFYLGPIED